MREIYLELSAEELDRLVEVALAGATLQRDRGRRDPALVSGLHKMTSALDEAERQRRRTFGR